MSIRKIAIGGLGAIAALALVAAIAANPFSTQASTRDATETRATVERLSADVVSPSQIAQPDNLGQLQAADPDEDADTAKPYIGVAVAWTDNDEIEVVKVMRDSPATEGLEEGDLITAIDGTAVSEVGDLSEAVESAGVGGTISLTITRDGASQTVDLTVGDWADAKHGWGKRSKRGKMLSGQMVYQDADGVNSTHTMVVGVASNVDADAGTFTLTPSDGSDATNYTITDDTKLMLADGDDLSALNDTDDVTVYSVDGEVKAVAQGVGGGRWFGKGGKRGFGGMMGRGKRGGHHGFGDKGMGKRGGHHGFDADAIKARLDKAGISEWLAENGLLPDGLTSNDTDRF